MPDTTTQTTARGMETARLLLDIKAVNFRPQEPYMLTAGWASPVYIDCRWVISFLDARRRIIDMGAEMLSENTDMTSVDMLAGGETAGAYGPGGAEAPGDAVDELRRRRRPRRCRDGRGLLRGAARLDRKGRRPDER